MSTNTPVYILVPLSGGGADLSSKEIAYTPKIYNTCTVNGLFDNMSKDRDDKQCFGMYQTGREPSCQDRGHAPSRKADLV